MVARGVVAILVLAASGLFAAQLRDGRAPDVPAPDFDRLPRAIGVWRADAFPTSALAEDVLAADQTLHLRFQHPQGAVVWFFLAYFARQQVNSQIHSPRNCLPGGGWTTRAVEQRRIGWGATPQPMTHMHIARDGVAQDVFYWFQTQSGPLAGEYAVKWDLVRNSLAGRPTNAAFVRFNALTADADALHELMALLHPALEDIFAQVGLQ